MQEDDDVSTESEDESPASPLGHQKEHHFNGSRLPRNASTSSNKSSPSPVSNKPYPNFSRETSVDGSRSSKRSASGRMDSSLKVNGDINVPTVSSRTLPTPAPRKYEKRVCVTTEL